MVKKRFVSVIAVCLYADARPHADVPLNTSASMPCGAVSRSESETRSVLLRGYGETSPGAGFHHIESKQGKRHKARTNP